MKCNNCNLQYCDSYEEQIYYCIFFGDGPEEPFCTEDGCKLKYKEAKKLERLLENCDVIMGDEVKEEDLQNLLIKQNKALEEYNEYYKKLEEKYGK
jgi:hypothetical protein